MQNVTKTSTLIRGGQTTQHWWRMGLQVLKFASVVSATLYVVLFVAIVAWDFDTYDMRLAFAYEMAERGVVDDTGFNKPYDLKHKDGTVETINAVDLYRSTEYRAVRDRFFQRIDYATYASVFPAVLVGIVSLIIFQMTGDKIQNHDFVRGARLVTSKQLSLWSKAQWRRYHRKHKGRKKADPLTIAGIPYPPNAAEAQTSIYGTVGVGKTNAMAEMLATIRKNGGRAIVYDRMGVFVSRFYDTETDIILNPFDSRSASWNIFDDILDAATITQIAEVLIPEHPGSSDPFWQQSARIVFDYAARALHKEGGATVSKLVEYVLNLPAEQLSQLIQSTPGRHFFNESIDKTAQSIRANLIAELRFLEFLREDGYSFSIREWVASDEPSVLFLTGDAEHAAATRNIISAVLEMSANAFMSLGRASEPRCYVFMDEVPSLNRLPFLISSLAEIRQFGVCYILGYQVFSQLEDIYGREGAQSINGNTNNRIIFSTPDHRTAKLCSESLGSEDLIEKTANISVGAHEARDGVGFQQTRVERALVTASQIQVLPQFEAYIKFAYDAPLARVQFDVFDVPDTVSPFLPYMGNAPGFNEGEIKVVEKPVKDDEAERLYDEFITWCGIKFGVSNADWMKNREEPPVGLRPYWDDFIRQRRAGLAVEHCQDIVVMTEGLMGQKPFVQERPVQIAPRARLKAAASNDPKPDNAPKPAPTHEGAEHASVFDMLADEPEPALPFLATSEFHPDHLGSKTTLDV